MSNLQDQMQKYHQMNQKKPDYDPLPVMWDHYGGIGLMGVFGFMALLMMVTVTTGGVEGAPAIIESIVVAVLCVVIVYLGFQMNARARYYDKSRKYLGYHGWRRLQWLRLRLYFPPCYYFLL